MSVALAIRDCIALICLVLDEPTDANVKANKKLPGLIILLREHANSNSRGTHELAIPLILQD